jgi:hypothetical protein
MPKQYQLMQTHHLNRNRVILNTTPLFNNKQEELVQLVLNTIIFRRSSNLNCVKNFYP